ncbi:aldose reductase-related protein 2-like [Daphnia pulex]|uniref:aldose reductase-related protein 2-like n=1 Tax=Daphnia pulex TaxID=6669 RepID=UPI001EDD0A0F|nr:aldose reductase-related protein 2-like [Daphnia pulex]
MSSSQNHITFWNGNKMPVVGLGTWQSSKEEIQKAVNAALEAGYRHIDTAYNYLNEDAIGEVLQQWIQSGKVKREELFIVTKLPMIGNRPEDVEKFLRKSLSALRLDYIDLYLIHAPIGLIGKHDQDVFPHDEQGFAMIDMHTNLVELWKSMEKQVDAGLVKSIGVSNFNEEQIKRIINNSRIKPANVQVEMHVQFQQKSLREFCQKHGLTICAYAPFASPGRNEFYSKLGLKPPVVIPDLFQHPVIVKIANKHKKSSAQILIKYLTELGVSVIPKSVSSERIRSNIQIFDFTLSPVDMAQLQELDLGEMGFTFEFSSFFKGMDKHPENPFPHRAPKN